MDDLCIGVVVCRCPVGKIEANLAETARWAEAARDAGADLVCLPELNITGYGYSNDLANLAEPVPGTISRQLAEIASDSDIAVLAGMIEKGADGHVFASHLMAAPNADPKVYRKCHLAPPEQVAFSPGDGVPVFEMNGWRVGIQLCYDTHFPELSTRMALAGADLIVMPHASPRGSAEDKHASWMRHLPARAYDNGIFVAACNQTGKNGNGLVFPGNAVIINPSGHVLATALTGDATLLTAVLPADDLAHVRDHRMRYFLPNRRPDLYCQNIEAPSQD